jgi:hypothetical protein
MQDVKEQLYRLVLVELCSRALKGELSTERVDTIMLFLQPQLDDLASSLDYWIKLGIEDSEK